MECWVEGPKVTGEGLTMRPPSKFALVRCPGCVRRVAGGPSARRPAKRRSTVADGGAHNLGAVATALDPRGNLSG